MQPPGAPPPPSDRRYLALPWYESLRPVMRSGHEVTLLDSGGEFFPALEAAINEATQRIFIETYIFEDDRTGRRIAAALAAAAQRGVRVHVLVDGFGTQREDGQWSSIIREAGVAIETFRPERNRYALNRRRLRRLHRKLAVIDGCVAFVGGLNILDDYYDPNHGDIEFPRLDYAVRVRGPLVAHVHVAAARLWWELSVINRSLRRAAAAAAGSTRHRVHLPESVVSDVTPAGTVRAALVLRDNIRFRKTIERAYLKAIGRSRREVLIACAYFFPGARFRRALLLAVRRGVRVRLLLQGKVEYKLQHYASQALYEELLRAGIEIIEYRRSFLHAKAAVVDDWATVGSSNIDPFSLLLAREANVMVQDAGFAQQLRSRIDEAIRIGGVPVVLQHHARRPWPVRLMNRIAFVILRIGVALAGTPGRY